MPYQDQFGMLGQIQDPVAMMGLGAPQSAQEMVIQQQLLQKTPAGMPIDAFFTGPSLVEKPTLSDTLTSIGLGITKAAANGASDMNALAMGLASYSDMLKGKRKEAQTEQMQKLQQYSLMSEIQDKELAREAAMRSRAAADKLKVQRPDLADVIDLDPKVAGGILQKEAEKKIEGGGGPFSGTSMDAQTTNILLRAYKDPSYASTPEYRAAYNLAAQDKITIGPDGRPQVVKPDMSAYIMPNEATGGQNAVKMPQGGMLAPETGTGPVSAAYGQMPGMLGDNIQQQVRMGPKGGVSIGDPTTTNIKGLKFSDGAQPTSEDAKTVKSILSASQRAEKLLAEREALIEKYPSPLEGTVGATLIDQNFGQIAAEYKDIKQLGTWDAGTEKLARDIIGDPVIRPGYPSASLFTKTGKNAAKVAKDQIKSAKENFAETLKSELSARGYEMDGVVNNAEKPAERTSQGKFKEGQRAKDANGNLIVFTNGSWRQVK